MTTSTTTRYLSAIALGAILTALAGRAAPVSTDQFSLSPSGLAPLGLPDRDVVRNPYSTLVGTTGSYSGLLPQTVGVVGPNLGLGVGFSPNLILGGGGGGGSTLALTVPSSSGGVPGGTGFGTSGGSSSSTVVSTVGLSAPVILPPGGGSSNQSSNIISALVAPQNVPDGGHSAMLLGSGLLLAWAVRRRLGRS